MLVKNIIKIEKGILIKGFTVKPFTNNRLGSQFDPKKTNLPRIATFNLDGWHYPEPSFKCPVIRTIFYPESTKPSFVKSVSAETIKEVGINKCIIQDPWNYWTDYSFIEFKKDKPIGVHMSEFIVGCVNKNKKSYVNFYTKVLLINGEIGYLAFETENKSKIEAELI